MYGGTMFRTLFSLLLTIPLIFSTAYASSSHHREVSGRHHTLSQLKRFFLLKGLIQQRAWPEVAAQVKIGAASHEITLQDLQSLSHTFPGTPFSYAVEGTKNILALPEKTGLTLKIAFQIALFAETSLNEEILKGKEYWPSREYGRELQYDHETKQFFIHLGAKAVKPIAVGKKKTITKTIRYDRSSPAIYARSASEYDLSNEFKILLKLEKFRNVLHPKALLTHFDTSKQKKYMTVIEPIYSPGSLHSVLKRGSSLKLTFKERAVIACDVVTGLAVMRHVLYTHRDISPRNFYVNIEGKKPNQRKIEVALTGVGKGLPICFAYRVTAQRNPSYLSPEGFFRSKMIGCDYLKSDTFAVGCILWQLFYGEMPAWAKVKYFQRKHLPLIKRYLKYTTLLNRTRAKPLKYLRSKQEKGLPLSVQDRFLEMILQMTDPDPDKRGEPIVYRRKFVALVNELNPGPNVRD
jgi:serine/threonine protein kinase